MTNLRAPIHSGDYIHRRNASNEVDTRASGTPNRTSSCIQSDTIISASVEEYSDSSNILRNETDEVVLALAGNYTIIVPSLLLPKVFEQIK